MSSLAQSSLYIDTMNRIGPGAGTVTKGLEALKHIEYCAHYHLV